MLAAATAARMEVDKLFMVSAEIRWMPEISAKPIPMSAPESSWPTETLHRRETGWRRPRRRSRTVPKAMRTSPPRTQSDRGRVRIGSGRGEGR